MSFTPLLRIGNPMRSLPNLPRHRSAVSPSHQLVCCVAALAVALAAAATSIAKDGFRPFKGRVVANWDNIFKALPPALGGQPPATFTGRSQDTHLGNAAQSGTLTLQLPNAQGAFPGSGSVTITAANGDKLTFDYTGLLDGSTGVGQGTFNFTGGTGRFAGATGSGTFYAQIDLSHIEDGMPKNQPMTVILDGKIAY